MPGTVRHGAWTRETPENSAYRAFRSILSGAGLGLGLRLGRLEPRDGPDHDHSTRQLRTGGPSERVRLFEQLFANAHTVSGRVHEEQSDASYSAPYVDEYASRSLAGSFSYPAMRPAERSCELPLAVRL